MSHLHEMAPHHRSSSALTLIQFDVSHIISARKQARKTFDKDIDKPRRIQDLSRNRSGGDETNLFKSHSLNSEPPKKNDANAEERFVLDLGIASIIDSRPVVNKDLHNLGSITARYNLELPKSQYDAVQTPAQQAAQDVRSNSVKLSKSEKFSVAMGTLDCVFQARLPDGKIIREPGRWIIVPARSEGTLKPLAKARFCVRLHQAEDENTNDLTAISAGIKGKL